MATLWITTDPKPLGEQMGEWCYNAMDCCITREVLDAIKPQLNEITGPVYDRARELQAPVLDMMTRGILVDMKQRKMVDELLSFQLRKLTDQLTRILVEGLGVPLEKISWTRKDKGEVKTVYLWNSKVGLPWLLYDLMRLPPVRSKGRITTDRKALEKLRLTFFAAPIVNHIIAIRDVRKQLGVVRTSVGADKRIRTSFNIAGTDTGRFNSYVSSYGDGTNLQNITGALRRLFKSDPGYKMGYVDLEQAESRAVGAIIWNLFKDGTYLDFCESGDLHTGVTAMTWRDLGWPSPVYTMDEIMAMLHDPELSKLAKTVAKQHFYRDFDYRDASKRLGHGTNYKGTAENMAREVRIKLELVREFQKAYFKGFPGIPAWHQWVADKLRKDRFITTFMGRQRFFAGRPWDKDTVKAAIAYEPQSCVADYLNEGMKRLWRKKTPVQLLLQVHDAIVFQYPEEQENEILPLVMDTLSFEVPLMHGRSLKIPTEGFVGWNWGYTKNARKELVNPDGIVPFTGNDKRKRSS